MQSQSSYTVLMDIQLAIVASTQDNDSQPSQTHTANMVSVAEYTSNSFMREERDFSLYPDPQNLYQQHPFAFNAMQNFEMDQNNSYTFAREFPSNTAFDSNTMYSEAPYHNLESPELRAVPSNYSTASGASAASSAMGSPHSIHGHVVPQPEWAPHGLGLNPDIVPFDGFSQSNEYNFAHSGMEEFAALEFPAKPHSFVGECKTISRCTSRQHGSISSNPESISSISTFVPSPRAVDMMPDQFSSPVTSRSIASPITTVGAANYEFREDCFESPSVSATPLSPLSSRWPSQALNASQYATSNALSRNSDVRSSPPSAVSQSSFTNDSGNVFSSYHQSPFFSQSSGNFVAPLESSCRFPLSIQRCLTLSCHVEKIKLLTCAILDPSILHQGPYTGRPASATQSSEVMYQPPAYPGSPAISHPSRSPMPIKSDSQSPYLSSQYSQYPYPPPRRQSVVSYSSDNFSSEESREKGRCTYPECGKVFKDLKAHMLTHQNERPEKCPIQTCDYHIKGFARKYDKNRHTLTHYKGTMVCGFCPGSGSAAEKSFNRADVFKRHLTSVHAVEQTPPNSRKKTSGNINSGKKLAGYPPDATGKCSTCSATFMNAQDFYEHLDDCVLRIVQQEEPSEAINAARLAEVEQDQAVHETLRNNSLPITTTNLYSGDDDEYEEEIDDENDDDFSLRAKSSRKGRGNRNPVNGVQKSRGLTHSKGGVTLNTKGRKKRKDYPSSWGCPTTQMKMKKRVLCVFDGPRRLWKDEMMLNTDYEVRMKLGDEKAYVTDLDIQTMRRADAFHTSTEEEKGSWVADDLTGMDLEKLMEVKREQ